MDEQLVRKENETKIRQASITIFITVNTTNFHIILSFPSIFLHNTSEPIPSDFSNKIHLANQLDFNYPDIQRKFVFHYTMMAKVY